MDLTIMKSLKQTAQALITPGKGILAADESTGSIKKRLESVSVVSTEETRRDYREMLFRTKAMKDYISGVILYDETIRQKAKDGTNFTDIIHQQGAIAGIKLDKGAKALALSHNETVTEGLDGLSERIIDYRKMGARFAKWRAVIDIGIGIPSYNAIAANAHALARYAALCQAGGLVPVVEPEILMDGDHTIERCAEVSELMLKVTFQELFLANVALEAIILKPNMVIAGKKCLKPANHEQVATATLKLLKACVPPAVPGIAFLSGGQSEEDATTHLHLMNSAGPLPWTLTYSYGRALQTPALKAWAGQEANIDAGQKAFAHRARMNSLAARGQWSKSLEV